MEKVTDDDGTIKTTVELSGKITPAEVQTLLELAIAGWRTQLGLPT